MERRTTEKAAGAGIGGVQSKRWAKLAVEASASLLRRIGRPARVRALMLLAVWLPSCKELWALSSWAVGAGNWARGVRIQKKIVYYKVFRIPAWVRPHPVNTTWIRPWMGMMLLTNQKIS